MKKVINAIRMGVFVGLAFVFACCSSPKDKKREQLRDQINQIQETLTRRSTEVVYGPPEMMEERAEQSRRMEAELDSLKRELKALDEK